MFEVHIFIYISKANKCKNKHKHKMSKTPEIKIEYCLCGIYEGDESNCPVGKIDPEYLEEVKHPKAPPPICPHGLSCPGLKNPKHAERFSHEPPIVSTSAILSSTTTEVANNNLWSSIVKKTSEKPSVKPSVLPRSGGGGGGYEHQEENSIEGRREFDWFTPFIVTTPLRCRFGENCTFYIDYCEGQNTYENKEHVNVFWHNETAEDGDNFCKPCNYPRKICKYAPCKYVFNSFKETVPENFEVHFRTYYHEKKTHTQSKRFLN